MYELSDEVNRLFELTSRLCGIREAMWERFTSVSIQEEDGLVKNMLKNGAEVSERTSTIWICRQKAATVSCNVFFVDESVQT